MLLIMILINIAHTHVHMHACTHTHSYAHTHTHTFPDRSQSTFLTRISHAAWAAFWSPWHLQKCLSRNRKDLALFFITYNYP